MRVGGFSNQIVECVRIARLLTKHGEIFLERVYSPDEIALCRASKQPTQMFAAYWACKEAVLKIAGIEDRKRCDWRVGPANGRCATVSFLCCTWLMRLCLWVLC